MCFLRTVSGVSNGEMTNRRARQIPIVDEGKLIGIISIGDIVKNRLDELEDEAQQMRDYIATSLVPIPK